MFGHGNNKPKTYDLIDHSFLSGNLKTAYKDLLEQRYSQLGLSCNSDTNLQIDSFRVYKVHLSYYTKRG